MTEEQFVKAKNLFEVQYSLEKSIENANLSVDWHQLIENFRRAGMPNFLGKFDEVKSAFIKKVTIELNRVNKEIEDI